MLCGGNSVRQLRQRTEGFEKLMAYPLDWKLSKSRVFDFLESCDLTFVVHCESEYSYGAFGLSCVYLELAVKTDLQTPNRIVYRIFECFRSDPKKLSLSDKSKHLHFDDFRTNCPKALCVLSRRPGRGSFSPRTLFPRLIFEGIRMS